ncbi:MAG: helix-turn-helix domain-containing protein [Muribaculum sp.]|nr:helix-turn-helix domain-containing protein [Muribaculum sp.]
MKFNVEKLKAVARPMTQEERAAMDYRAENADWLQLSATIALKIRKLLRQKGMTQVDLADRLGVTPPQVSKLLSGKINFELKTLVSIQKALGTPFCNIVLP